MRQPQQQLAIYLFDNVYILSNVSLVRERPFGLFDFDFHCRWEAWPAVNCQAQKQTVW